MRFEMDWCFLEIIFSHNGQIEFQFFILFPFTLTCGIYCVLSEQVNNFHIQNMHECVNGKVMHLTLALCDEFSTAARFQSGHEQRLSLTLSLWIWFEKQIRFMASVNQFLVFSCPTAHQVFVAPWLLPCQSGIRPHMHGRWCSPPRCWWFSSLFGSVVEAQLRCCPARISGQF